MATLGDIVVGVTVTLAQPNYAPPEPYFEPPTRPPRWEQSIRINEYLFGQWVPVPRDATQDWVLANVLGNVSPYEIFSTPIDLGYGNTIVEINLTDIYFGSQYMQLITTWSCDQNGCETFTEPTDGSVVAVSVTNGQVYLIHDYNSNVVSVPYYLD